MVVEIGSSTWVWTRNAVGWVPDEVVQKLAAWGRVSGVRIGGGGVGDAAPKTGSG